MKNKLKLIIGAFAMALFCAFYIAPTMEAQALCLHSWQNISTKTATCTSGGYTTQRCRKCKTTRNVNSVGALGHNCTTTVTAATCTSQGYTTHKCTRSNCSYSYRDTYTSVKAHSYTVYRASNAPTCTTDGYSLYVCSGCGKENKTIKSKLGHNYTTTVTAATCTSQGYTTHKCTRCSYSYKDSYTSVKAHSYTVYRASNAPTCTTDGYSLYVCSGCGKENKTIKSKLGHNYTTTVTAATCTSQGYTTHKCTRCSSSYKDTYTSVKAHSYTVYRASNAPTCTTDGYSLYVCSGCGKENKTITSKLGHNYTTHTVTNPTCSTKGYTTHSCGRCSYSYKDNYTEVVDHSYTIYRASNAPTCTTTGYKLYVCACGKEQKTTIPAYGHNKDVKITPASCKDEGLKIEYCKRCNTELSRTVIGKTENHVHTGEFVVTKAATCTSTGKKTGICHICGTEMPNITSTIEVTPHTPSNTWTVGTAKTCVKDGTLVKRCTSCKTILETKVDKCVGHHTTAVNNPTNPAPYTIVGNPTCQKIVVNTACKECKQTVQKELSKYEADKLGIKYEHTNLKYAPGYSDCSDNIYYSDYQTIGYHVLECSGCSETIKELHTPVMDEQNAVQHLDGYHFVTCARPECAAQQYVPCTYDDDNGEYSTYYVISVENPNAKSNDDDNLILVESHKKCIMGCGYKQVTFYESVGQGMAKIDVYSAVRSAASLIMKCIPATAIAVDIYETIDTALSMAEDVITLVEQAQIVAEMLEENDLTNEANKIRDLACVGNPAREDQRIKGYIDRHYIKY